MNVISQSWEWVNKPLHALELIELAGRVCYQSEDRITEDSHLRFCRNLLDKQHESVIEHVSATVRFITNRGVTHELVRHRLASFSQESTRYVKYDGGMEFIEPVWWDEWSAVQKQTWLEQMSGAEQAYCKLLRAGAQPQQAREVLPNSLKTEIVVTANLREWRHIFRLRCSTAAHPQIRQLMRNCLEGFQAEIPILFENLGG